jgi:hypothetical protein
MIALQQLDQAQQPTRSLIFVNDRQHVTRKLLL